MKKTIISLFLLATLSLQAQNYKPETYLGVNGGVTLSQVNFIPVVKQSMLQGLDGGLTFRYISESHFGLIIESNLAQRGWKENFTDTTLSYSRTLNYLEIPFLTHVTFGNHKYRFFVNLGPKVAFLLSDKEKRNFTNKLLEEHGKTIDNRLDYGLVGGAGFELRTGVGCFLLEGRYYYALSDVFSNAKKEYFDRSANNSISVNLTYLIPWQKLNLSK
ncbi:porin family protein [Parabacteroides sp. FAFU027]|uniref:porin family protein n=1 Tax=Parabacteroides sp. FAFU027 TaxID=2922715 RepID=UPI001FAE8007|nr:porin family protein [Parabacteroides sp. FAFU027]